MRRVVVGTVVAVVLAIPGVAMADSWLPPQAETYNSLDGNWRATVHPRRISSSIDYFEDKVAGVEPSGGHVLDIQASPVAVVERRVGESWELVWQRPLRNDVAPTEAVVLPDGYLLTLDNWHFSGFGEDADVIYDSQGNEAAAFALDDFLGADYVQALPRSVSSIWWRDDARALPDGKHVAVPVVVPNIDREAAEAYIDVVFDVIQGTVERPAGQEWEAALDAAHAVTQEEYASREAWRRRFFNPLLPPRDEDDIRAWNDYLDEAFLRMVPEAEDRFPFSKVLPPRDSELHDRSIGWIEDAIMEGEDDGIFGSPDQALLADVLGRAARNLTDSMLEGVRIYVVLDDTRFARVRESFRGTGAWLVQIDPTKPIPQRAERIERYLKDQAE